VAQRILKVQRQDVELGRADHGFEDDRRVRDGHSTPTEDREGHQRLRRAALDGQEHTKENGS
jgi:hypothetical protein